MLLCEFQGCKRPFRSSWELLEHLQREHALELFSSAVTTRAMPAAETGIEGLSCALFGRAHSFSAPAGRAHDSSDSSDSWPHSGPVAPLALHSPPLSVGSDELSPTDSEKRAYVSDSASASAGSGDCELRISSHLLPIHVPIHIGDGVPSESCSPTADGARSGLSPSSSSEAARPMPRLKACEHCGHCFRFQQEFHAHRRVCAKRKSSTTSDASASHTPLSEATDGATAASNNPLLVSNSPDAARKRLASCELHAAESAKQSKLDATQMFLPTVPQQTPQFEEATGAPQPQMLLALTALLMQQQALAQLAASAPNGSTPNFGARCPLPTTAALPHHFSEQKPPQCDAFGMAAAPPTSLFKHLCPPLPQGDSRAAPLPLPGHVYAGALASSAKSESQALLESLSQCASTPSSSASQSQGDSRIPSRQSAAEFKPGVGVGVGGLPSSLLPVPGLALGFTAADMKHLAAGRHRGRERRSDTCEFCGKVFKVCSALLS